MQPAKSKVRPVTDIYGFSKSGANSGGGFSSAEVDSFYEKLISLYESSGLSLLFNFRETSLDLHEFYKEVTQRGGLHEVTAKEKWGEIASIMNSKCNVKLSANQLQTLYGMTLYQFEQTYHCPSPSPSAPKSPGYGSDKGDGAGFDDEDDHSREKLLTAKKRKKEKHSSSLINREVGAAFEIPEELKQLLNAKKGSNPVFVIQKQLFGSDVDPNKGRLSLPLSQLSGEFLTQDEKDFLSKQTIVRGKKPRIQARIFEPCGEEREICVAKWKMGSIIYSFIGAWNQVVKMNALRNGMHIQLWSFRVDSQLCFFLLKVMER